MVNEFLCPECDRSLRIGNHLILKVRNRKKQVSLMLLSPEIGNYRSIKHRSFETGQGDFIGFFCPLCNKALNSGIHKNLAHIVMIDENNRRTDVYFSKIAGEHSSYLTEGDSLRAEGEDAGRYTWFRLGDRFKRYI